MEDDDEMPAAIAAFGVVAYALMPGVLRWLTEPRPGAASAILESLDALTLDFETKLGVNGLTLNQKALIQASLERLGSLQEAMRRPASKPRGGDQ